jgi:putative FmdB family regulatory protein
MPTYEYQCPAGHEFEVIQKISDKPRTKCSICGRPATRKISGGAGFVFKGTGFYITDYGKDGKGPRKEPAKAATAEKSESTAEAKPEAAPEKSEKAAPTKPKKSEKGETGDGKAPK